VPLQQYDLPLTINISLNGCDWKKYAEKRLLEMFLTEVEVLMGVKTLIKISVQAL